MKSKPGYHVASLEFINFLSKINKICLLLILHLCVLNADIGVIVHDSRFIIDNTHNKLLQSCDSV